MEHIIAGKGICFEEALQPEFEEYAKQVVYNAKVFAQRFISNGWHVISNGTENHMFVLDVYGSIGITGRQAEEFLDNINITLNKNQIPNDELPPLKSSGVRIGTPAMTTKGWGKDEFIKLADLIDEALRAYATDLGKYNEITDEMWQEYKNIYVPIVKSIIEGVSK